MLRLATAIAMCPPCTSEPAADCPATLEAAAAAQREIVDVATLRLMNHDHSEFLLSEYERERDTLVRLLRQLALAAGEAR